MTAARRHGAVNAEEADRLRLFSPGTLFLPRECLGRQRVAPTARSAPAVVVRVW
jgi:hypothetical protein